MKAPTSGGRAHGRDAHPSTAIDGAATRRFPATTASVGQARRFLLGQLPAATPTRSADALVLMLSELATNAVQHAATEFEVAVHVAPDGGHVRVEVSDGATGFPTPRSRSPDAPARARAAHRRAPWPTPGASRCGATGPARRCGSRCRWPRRGRRPPARPDGAAGRRERAHRPRPRSAPPAVPAPVSPAAARARVARPGGAGGARRTARRRRRDRRARDDPLRQQRSRGSSGLAPRRPGRAGPSSTSCPIR